MYVELWPRSRDSGEPGGFPGFGGGGGGPAEAGESGAERDELAESMEEPEDSEPREDELEPEGEGEGDEEPEDPAAEVARLRREVKQLERVKGRQGRQLGEYQRILDQVRAGAGRSQPGGQPPADAPHPVAAGMQSYLTTGDLTALAQAIDLRIAQLGAPALARLEQTLRGEVGGIRAEREFFEEHGEYERGLGRRIFEGEFARLRALNPGTADRDLREQAAEAAEEMLVEMGYELAEEDEDARGAARRRQTAPGRGARRPGGPGPRLRTPEEAMAFVNRQAAQAVADASGRRIRPRRSR